MKKILAIVLMFMVLTALFCACNKPITNDPKITQEPNPTDVVTADSEKTDSDETNPLPNVPADECVLEISEDAYQPTLAGEQPTIPEAIIDYLNLHFAKMEIFSVDVVKIGSWDDDGNFNEHDSDVTEISGWGYLNESDDSIYVRVQYCEGDQTVYSSLYEDPIATALVRKVANDLGISLLVDAEYDVYFTQKKDGVYCLPANVTTVDELLKENIDKNYYGLSVEIEQPTNTLLMAKITDDKLESVMMDYKLTELEIVGRKTTEHVSYDPYYWDERIEVSRQDKNVTIVRTKYESATCADGITVIYDPTYVSATVEKTTTIPDKYRDEYDQCGKEAFKVVVTKVKDAADGIGYEDVVTKENKYGGETTVGCFNVYDMAMYPGLARMGTYFYNEFGPQECYDEETDNEAWVMGDIYIYNSDFEDGKYITYILFFNSPSESNE